MTKKDLLKNLFSLIQVVYSMNEEKCLSQLGENTFFFKYLFINYTSMYVSIENICMHNFLADRKIMVVLLKCNTHIHTNTFLLCDEMGWRCE